MTARRRRERHQARQASPRRRAARRGHPPLGALHRRNLETWRRRRGAQFLLGLRQSGLWRHRRQRQDAHDLCRLIGRPFAIPSDGRGLYQRSSGLGADTGWTKNFRSGLLSAFVRRRYLPGFCSPSARDVSGNQPDDGADWPNREYGGHAGFDRAVEENRDQHHPFVMSDSMNAAGLQRETRVLRVIHEQREEHGNVETNFDPRTSL